MTKTNIVKPKSTTRIIAGILCVLGLIAIVWPFLVEPDINRHECIAYSIFPMQNGRSEAASQSAFIFFVLLPSTLLGSLLLALGLYKYKVSPKRWQIIVNTIGVFTLTVFLYVLLSLANLLGSKGLSCG